MTRSVLNLIVLSVPLCQHGLVCISVINEPVRLSISTCSSVCQHQPFHLTVNTNLFSCQFICCNINLFINLFICLSASTCSSVCRHGRYSPKLFRLMNSHKSQIKTKTWLHALYLLNWTNGHYTLVWENICLLWK